MYGLEERTMRSSSGHGYIRLENAIDELHATVQVESWKAYQVHNYEYKRKRI